MEERHDPPEESVDELRDSVRIEVAEPKRWTRGSRIATAIGTAALAIGINNLTTDSVTEVSMLDGIYTRPAIFEQINRQYADPNAPLPTKVETSQTLDKQLADLRTLLDKHEANAAAHLPPVDIYLEAIPEPETPLFTRKRIEHPKYGAREYCDIGDQPITDDLLTKLEADNCGGLMYEDKLSGFWKDFEARGMPEKNIVPAIEVTQDNNDVPMKDYLAVRKNADGSGTWISGDDCGDGLMELLKKSDVTVYMPFDKKPVQTYTKPITNTASTPDPCDEAMSEAVTPAACPLPTQEVEVTPEPVVEPAPAAPPVMEAEEKPEELNCTQRYLNQRYTKVNHLDDVINKHVNSTKQNGWTWYMVGDKLKPENDGFKGDDVVHVLFDGEIAYVDVDNDRDIDRYLRVSDRGLKGIAGDQRQETLESRLLSEVVGLDSRYVRNLNRWGRQAEADATYAAIRKAVNEDFIQYAVENCDSEVVTPKEIVNRDPSKTTLVVDPYHPDRTAVIERDEKIWLFGGGLASFNMRDSKLDRNFITAIVGYERDRKRLTGEDDEGRKSYTQSRFGAQGRLGANLDSGYFDPHCCVDVGREFLTTLGLSYQAERLKATRKPTPENPDHWLTGLGFGVESTLAHTTQSTGNGWGNRGFGRRTFWGPNNFFGGGGFQNNYTNASLKAVVFPSFVKAKTEAGIFGDYTAWRVPVGVYGNLDRWGGNGLQSVSDANVGLTAGLQWEHMNYDESNPGAYNRTVANIGAIKGLTDRGPWADDKGYFASIRHDMVDADGRGWNLKLSGGVTDFNNGERQWHILPEVKYIFSTVAEKALPTLSSRMNDRHCHPRSTAYWCN